MNYSPHCPFNNSICHKIGKFVESSKLPLTYCEEGQNKARQVRQTKQDMQDETDIQSPKVNVLSQMLSHSLRY